MRTLLIAGALTALVTSCAKPPPTATPPQAQMLAPAQPRVAAPCASTRGRRCIAVVAADAASANAATVIADDLVRSERFVALRDADVPLRDADVPRIAMDLVQWRGSGVEYVVTVSGARARGIDLRIDEVASARTLMADALPLARLMSPRAVAHQGADAAFERLTGTRGIAATQIAYVDRVADRGAPMYRLVIADADGANATALVQSREPLLSPAWSPDATQVAYMGYDRGPASLFVLDLRSGATRKLVSEATGVGAPAWSPDGREIAFTLNGRSGSDIFVLDVASGARRQLTQAPGIDTEAAWSPDGRTLAFTSDRGGQPRIYTAPASGGGATLLTRNVRQGLRPSFAPDGRSIAFIALQGSRFKLALIGVGGGSMQVLGEGPGDDSPSFAPNGSKLLYAAQGASGRGELYAISLETGVRTRLHADADIRAAAWSPFRSRRVP